MTIQLPAPLVPPEVDLRDFGFMPLDVLRLRDSDLAALASGDEFKAAVLLWCVAWHQVPAASLPKDDRLLARFSGAGPGWKKIREEALRGFVECSDGRYYHAVIAEKANESWRAKVAQRERTKAATEAREAKRRAAFAQRDDQRDEQRDEQRDGPRHDQRDVVRDVHQGTGTGTVKGQGQGQGQGDSTATAVAAAAKPPMSDLPDKPTEIAHMANFLTRMGFDPAQVHAVKSRTALKAWIDAGVSWALMNAAIESARKRLGGALPASPRYLIPLLQTLMAAGDEPEADRIARLEKQIFGEESIDATA
jgi:hypothetical protein